MELSMFSGILTYLHHYLITYRYRNKDKADTRDLGWDGKCSSCGQWMHRNNLVVSVVTDEDHWHYHCACGGTQHWNLNLAPVPILEGYTTPDGDYVEVLPLSQSDTSTDNQPQE